MRNRCAPNPQRRPLSACVTFISAGCLAAQFTGCDTLEMGGITVESNGPHAAAQRNRGLSDGRREEPTRMDRAQ